MELLTYNLRSKQESLHICEILVLKITSDTMLSDSDTKDFIVPTLRYTK